MELRNFAAYLLGLALLLSYPLVLAYSLLHWLTP